MIKILCVVGTRPEAIKMAPVITALKKDSRFFVRILATAQHREMLDQVFRVFNIEPDIDLDIMQSNQDLTTLTGRLLIGLNEVMLTERPNAVLAQGDTTTVLTTALSCFYHKIPFGHIEAGLRTWDINNPFPEEMNRTFVSKIATWHFAPTNSSCENLINDGVIEDKIHITGNTVIDALYSVINIPVDSPIKLELDKRLILVTIHRRENFGLPIIDICNALLILLENNFDIQIVFPVHPNPNVQVNVYKILGNNLRVFLISPVDYLTFVQLMKSSFLILSDSGGLQEEAPALNKPVLILRDSTERPEAVELGVTKLIGTESEVIVNEVQRLLDDSIYYKQMQKGISPYGDGLAASRIIQVLKNYFMS